MVAARESSYVVCANSDINKETSQCRANRWFSVEIRWQTMKVDKLRNWEIRTGHLLMIPRRGTM